MFTVTNNVGQTLTLYDGGQELIQLANGATGNVNQLNVSAIGFGNAIFANSSGGFANGQKYTATYENANAGFPLINVLFTNGLPGGNVRFY